MPSASNAPKLRPITKSELHPTPLSGALCHPLSGKSCTNVPTRILEGDGYKLPMCGVHARVAKQQIERIQREKNPDITDRAKRYRAKNSPPPGAKRCNFCASRKNIDIDHIDGDEGNNAPENKMFLCRSCNVAKGIVQARNRIGIRTSQYNPQRVPTFPQFQKHARVLLGIENGDAGQSTAAVLATPPETRAKYSGMVNSKNPPTYSQYAMAASIHTRGKHDEGGAIIHATPPALRHRYALQIARTKKQRREVPF